MSDRANFHLTTKLLEAGDPVCEIRVEINGRDAGFAMATDPDGLDRLADLFHGTALRARDKSAYYRRLLDGGLTPDQAAVRTDLRFGSRSPARSPGPLPPTTTRSTP